MNLRTHHERRRILDGVLATLQSLQDEHDLAEYASLIKEIAAEAKARVEEVDEIFAEGCR